MRTQQGFTLIELVVVIIILGILAVVAAPKFINLQGDARLSTLKGMKAAIQSANSLVYSKASLAGEEKKQSGEVDIGSVDKDGHKLYLYTAYGYIGASMPQVGQVLGENFNLATSRTDPTIAVDEGSEWTAYDGSNSQGINQLTIWQKGAPASCAVHYYPAQNAQSQPTFGPLPAASDC
ncbi:type II secretion system protein [Shewanella maritima]|uniref:Type II secretion system protein n=1 Tax=Shewanella maritima TaxID=2520507 RepID=A0A411PIG2_9GAMM|nr:type II secretion system protein [Shewanella maritima]QBF83333.1 type II secretion system protein [Shewanella maritima]